MLQAMRDGLAARPRGSRATTSSQASSLRLDTTTLRAVLRQPLGDRAADAALEPVTSATLPVRSNSDEPFIGVSPSSMRPI